ncbi:uncharacterized protein LOC131148312 [Malania oleifera]|uniref:uncharacterized protein LOC131148312 n=1 Tax=Malania oleifera TaxID=397392 RepID=UPI0025ADF815|nr:uncharacterized protein LOC131148312 [Malania oleifera]
MGCFIDQFTRLKPSVFVGSANPVHTENWIQEIEEILHVLKCTKKQKVTFGMFKLSREVERWCVSVEKMEEHRLILVAMTWSRFRELFFERYFSATVRNAKMEEFRNLSQKSLSLQDFATLVNKATVAEESLLEDVEVQVLKKRPTPPSCSFGARQGNWKRNSRGTFQNTATSQVCSLCGRKLAGRDIRREIVTCQETVEPHNNHTEAQRGGQQGGTAQARVYCLTPSDAENAGDVVTGSVVGCSKVVCEFSVEILGRVLLVNLGPSDMYGFDIILGMDWSSASYASIDRRKREVIFRLPGQHEFKFLGSCVHSAPQIVLALHARRLLREGCQGYLTFLKDTLTKECKLEAIAVVCEFPNVFPEDLPGLPPDCEVEFAIELATNMAPISKALYRMALDELRELKEQL